MLNREVNTKVNEYSIDWLEDFWFFDFGYNQKIINNLIKINNLKN